MTDGQEVFGLQVVDTPGHTPGHIAVFDNDSRVLVAGDALTNTIDGLEGPMPEYTMTCRQPKSRSASSPLWSPRSSSSATVPPSSETPPPSFDG